MLLYIVEHCRGRALFACPFLGVYMPIADHTIEQMPASGSSWTAVYIGDDPLAADTGILCPVKEIARL